MTQDRVIETPDGFDCIVGGQQFGTWGARAIARAGMAVEQRRAASRGAAAARAELARLAAARIQAARRALDGALLDPLTPLARIGFLRAGLIQAERAAADLDDMTIPPGPALQDAPHG